MTMTHDEFIQSVILEAMRRGEDPALAVEKAKNALNQGE